MQVTGSLHTFPAVGRSLLSCLCSLSSLDLLVRVPISPLQFNTAIQRVLHAIGTGSQGHGGQLEQLKLVYILRSSTGRLQGAYWSAESLNALATVAPNLQHLQLDLSTAVGVGHTDAAAALLAHIPPGLKSFDLLSYPTQVSKIQYWSSWVPSASLQTFKLTLLEDPGGTLPAMDCTPLASASFQSLTICDPVGVLASPASLCSSLPTSLQKLSLQMLHGTAGLSRTSLSHLTQLQVCILQLSIQVLVQLHSKGKGYNDLPELRVEAASTLRSQEYGILAGILAPITSRCCPCLRWTQLGLRLPCVCPAYAASMYLASSVAARSHGGSSPPRGPLLVAQ
jgi:hypothetical protein